MASNASDAGTGVEDADFAFVPSNDTFTIQRVADILRDGGHDKKAKIHQLAMGIAEACVSITQLNAAPSPFAAILFDELERTFEIVEFRSSVITEVVRASSHRARARFWGLRPDSLDHDVAIIAKTACTPVHASPTHGKIVLMLVRDAAWRWIRFWHETHKRSVVRLFERLLRVARDQDVDEDPYHQPQRRQHRPVRQQPHQYRHQHREDQYREHQQQRPGFARTCVLSWDRIVRETPASVCASCGGFARRACKGCSTVLYCSPECQKKHWVAAHRSACGSARGRPDGHDVDYAPLRDFLCDGGGFETAGDLFCRKVLSGSVA